MRRTKSKDLIGDRRSPLAHGATCQMCGLADGDPEPLGEPGTVKLTLARVTYNDSSESFRVLCTTCSEGLQHIVLPKPDRVHLLSQVRRATTDDQEAVLKWLLEKYKLTAIPKK